MGHFEADERWLRWMGALANYHSWEVVGFENCPREGGAVLAATHSLASYELFIAAAASWHLIGRPTYILGDELMFKIPGLAQFIERVGFIRGDRQELIRRLRAGDLIGIAPGGMKESLRPSSRAHRFDWSRRVGFAAVALAAGVPVVPVVCPNADRIFTVYSSPLTELAYRKLKVPMPIFRGRGPTLIPRPVRLTQYVGKPIYPDVAPDQVQDDDVLRFHARVVQAVETLMEQAKAHSDASAEGVRTAADAFPSAETRAPAVWTASESRSGEPS